MNKKFIKASNEYCTFEKYVPAPYLRRTFELDSKPDFAEISICGLGFYLLYINGQEITKGELAPYISNPDHCCYYDTYNITGLLNEGENVIGIILGNGFFNSFGGKVWDFDKADWVGAPRVAVELKAHCGEKEVYIEADERFKVHPSGIVFDEYRMGEYYDEHYEVKDWNMLDFDDSQWNNAICAEAPRGDMLSCNVEPIKIIKKIKPVQILKQKEGYLYDFGENVAGVCELNVLANEGQKIILRHGETLNNGEFTIDNIIFHNPGTEYFGEYAHKDIFIADKDGHKTYRPRFTYHGFRYVLVSGITEEQANEALLTCCVMNSELKEIGGFECSDNTANLLFSMVKRSDLSNYYYFPTDCPHREKNGWTGDAVASAEHMALLYDVKLSWHEWLRNIRKSQNDGGGLPAIVPTGDWGYVWGCGPAWDKVLFELPYEMYKKRGDIEIIKENAHAMLRYLEYIMTQRNEDGTVTKGLGDWAQTGIRKCSQYTTPLALSDSICVMDMANKAHEMFEAVGYTHHSSFAAGIFEDMRNTIRSKLVDFSQMTVKGETQTGQAMALYYGVFDDSEKNAAFSVLLKMVHDNNDAFDCGFLGLRVLFHVLSEFGEAELAYDMITRKEYPSYGHMIELGETTLPEQFMPDGEFRNSHNHHFMGDIANWFISELAGLKVIDSEHIEVRPKFIKQLDSASAYHDLPKGRVYVSWKRCADKVKLEIQSPVEYKIVIQDKYKHMLSN